MLDTTIPGIGALVGKSVLEVERALILTTLDRCLGNRTQAAKVLRISIRTLRNKINKYSSEGIHVPPSQYQQIFDRSLLQSPMNRPDWHQHTDQLGGGECAGGELVR